jgi:hypothetical protein
VQKRTGTGRRQGDAPLARRLRLQTLAMNCKSPRFATPRIGNRPRVVRVQWPRDRRDDFEVRINLRRSRFAGLLLEPDYKVVCGVERRA